MTLKRISALTLVAALWMAVVGLSVDGHGQTKQPKPKVEKDLPIQIVSDRLEAYNEKRMVVFSGNAVATQGARTIRGDVLTLYYKEAKNKEKGASARKAEEGEGPGDLERVEAKGRVTISEGDRIVTGDEAIYIQDEQKITVTGSAVLREGANIIRGDRVFVYLDENRGVVEGAVNKRVTATIYPEEKKDKKKP